MGHDPNCMDGGEYFDQDQGPNWTPANYNLPDPLFDLQVAYKYVPMQYDSLRKFLSRHKHLFPARYRRTTGGRRIRLLSATEIQQIRSMVLVFGPGQLPKMSVVKALFDTSEPPSGSLP